MMSPLENNLRIPSPSPTINPNVPVISLILKFEYDLPLPFAPVMNTAIKDDAAGK